MLEFIKPLYYQTDTQRRTISRGSISQFNKNKEVTEWDNHIRIFDNLFQSNISKFQNLTLVNHTL